MKILSVLLALCWIGWAHASTPAEGASGPKVEYIPLSPPFVANFGTSATNARLSYVKADIAVRTSTPAATEAVKYHMPYLRNELVMLLSSQDMETMTTNEGKEKLRAEALAKVQAVLQQEEGAPLVEDLLFSSFVIQR